MALQMRRVMARTHSYQLMQLMMKKKKMEQQGAATAALRTTVQSTQPPRTAQQLSASTMMTMHILNFSHLTRQTPPPPLPRPCSFLTSTPWKLCSPTYRRCSSWLWTAPDTGSSKPTSKQVSKKP